MAFDNLLIERDAAVAIVTINRPKVLNALNAATLDELRRAILDFKQDESIRVVVLTGGGDKSFVAGADINELGYALGGGCELAMACTLRLAADTAKLGQPEVHLGLLPGYAGTQRLARLVGKGKAMEMILTGTPISASEAERVGLVNRVVPAADLLVETRKLATALAAQAPIAMRYIIAAINQGLEMPFAQGCAYEATLFGLSAATDDMREGTRAFLEKRQPVFHGR